MVAYNFRGKKDRGKKKRNIKLIKTWNIKLIKTWNVKLIKKNSTIKFFYLFSCALF